MGNEKELYMMMQSGEQKTEFRSSDFNPEHQLAVLDGLFKFFDIDVNFRDMIATYNKTGKAYREFYGELETPTLTEVNEPVEVKIEVEEPAIERPVFTNTKLKADVLTYKCHYICPTCKKRANKYIGKYERTINCHDCFKLMPVQTATENGDLEQDVFGNFFIAGEFRRKRMFKL